MSIFLGVAAGLAGSIAINTGNNLQSLGMLHLSLAQALEADEKRDAEDPATVVEDESTIMDSPKKESKVKFEEADKSLKKTSSQTEEEDEELPPINPSDSKVWVLGTCIFVTGSLLNFASYGLAPQSLLASLEAVQFVTNVIFGKCALGKEITNRMYLGTGLTVAGTVLTVLFSSRQAAEIKGIKDLMSLWLNGLWIGYLVFIVILGVVLHLTYLKYDAAKQAGTPFPNSNNIMAVIYAVFSALFGTLSVVFAKLLAELLDLLFQGIQIFSHYFTYICLFSWLILMSVWLFRLNDALGLYDPLFIIPLLQANFIFFAIVSGGIYFQEFNYMEAYQWGGFVSGVSVIFFGLYLLAPTEEEQEQSIRMSEPPKEEAEAAARGREKTIDYTDIYAPQTGIRRKNTMRRISTANLHESAAMASTLATEVFMGSTAQINFRHMILYREQELKKIQNKKHLTPDETRRIREHMKAIRQMEKESESEKHAVVDALEDRESEVGETL